MWQHVTKTDKDEDLETGGSILKTACAIIKQEQLGENKKFRWPQKETKRKCSKRLEERKKK